MAKQKNIRTNLSKKIRFEVLKRDKFQCNYCGKQAPDVVLEIDHIKPVSKGGTNDLLNLITSCFDCNRGKANNEISDDSVVKKQRTQLEELQLRREQIELMMEWKQGLSSLDEDVAQKIIDYMESKIGHYTLNNNGKKGIKKLSKKFNVSDIMDAIDVSATKYLRYDQDDNLEKESVEKFVDKIGGILTLKNKPIEQKLAYIKGICRNRFDYWSPQRGAIILSDYVSALKNANYSDDQIAEDLENEVIPKTKNSPHWSAWRDVIEGWTDEVNSWPKENS
jgi:hypothetical protein